MTTVEKVEAAKDPLDKVIVLLEDALYRIVALEKQVDELRRRNGN